MAEHVREILAPVFIRLIGNFTFKQMKSEDISKIVKELESKIGVFEKGGVTIASGGDLFIRPSTRDQLRELLSTQTVLNGTVEVKCSLPNSHSTQRVIIRRVPTGDTSEEIQGTLTEQGYKIKNVHRFTISRGHEKIPSSTVALEFEGKVPAEILLNGLVFYPEKQLPSPLRCKKCQKLGHTERFCNTTQACPNCSKNHEDYANCPLKPFCVNCSGEHPASSPTCPKFLQMRAITRAAADKGVPIQEVRGKSYSEAARGNLPFAPDPDTEILKSQVQALQTEMARIRTEAGKIKIIEKKVDKLENNVNQIQNTLNTLEKGQTAIESGQMTTNSKLDKLTDLFTRNFPNIDNVEMEFEADEEDSVTTPSNERKTKTNPSRQEKETGSPSHNQAVKRLATGPKKPEKNK